MNLAKWPGKTIEIFEKNWRGNYLKWLENCMKKQIIIQTEGKKVQIDRNNMYKKWSGKPFK